MNAFVLALAALTAGDGGTGAAATAPAYFAPTFAGPLQGTLHFGTLGAYEIEYGTGRLTIRRGGGSLSGPCAITCDGPGWARVRWAGTTYRCRFRLKDGHLDLVPAGSAQQLWHENIMSYRIEIKVKVK